MKLQTWQLWALASAGFAGLTGALGKKGVESVPSNLATALRTAMVLAIAATVAAATGEVKIEQVPRRAWLWLAASALATAGSWLCYWRALKTGPLSGVAPIDKLSFVIAVALGWALLGEKVPPNVLVGSAVIVAGVVITVWK